MKLSADCIFCLIERQHENIKRFDDEAVKADYMREVLRIVANAGEDSTTPAVLADINRLHQAVFGESYSFEALKREYNSLLLQREPELCSWVEESEEPLLMAVKFARVGNYIDFGAMKQIDNSKLDQLLSTADDEQIDPAVYQAFVQDLQSAKRLVYLTDNCGEIVLDKILIKTIAKQYPSLYITVIVRGKPVLNDATVEDAEAVGMPQVAEVMGNGTEIAGTQLNAIDASARGRIEQADLIISKGQGNFETLHGCGLNIYYLFLCKCDWFVRRFQMERFKGVFVRECGGPSMNIGLLADMPGKHEGG